MKQLLSVIALVLAVSAGALAHNGNEHVRGVITAVSAQSVTVQLPDKSTKTLSISAKTEFETSGKPAHLGDVKIGDRVVIDVPEHGTNALSIKVGAAKK
jgi:hypothetical protein